MKLKRPYGDTDSWGEESKVQSFFYLFFYIVSVYVCLRKDEGPPAYSSATFNREVFSETFYVYSDQKLNTE